MAVVDEVLGVADAVKASSEDLEWLAPGRAPAEVAAEWGARGPALVVVTRGGDGAVAFGRSCGVVERPGVEVRVVDTVGAGDTFMAALIAGLHSRDLLGADARDALGRMDAAAIGALLDEAIRASAVTCSRLGADPPTAAELRAGAPWVS
jgi:fructokinase